MSQAQIKNNFGDLNTIFGFDHVTFDASSDNGKHNAVTMPDLTANPPAQAVLTYGQMVALHNEADTSTQPRPTWNDNNHGIYYPMAPIVAYGTYTFPAGTLTAMQTFNCSTVDNGGGWYTVTLSPTLLQIAKATTSPGFWYSVFPSAGDNFGAGGPTNGSYSVVSWSNATPSKFDLVVANPVSGSRGAPQLLSFIVVQF